MYYNIAVDVPLRKTFCYSCSEELQLGQRVLVEFGARKKMVGFVWQTNVPSTAIDYDLDKIKPILTVFPEVIPAQIIDLVTFCTNYYHYPIGQTIFTAIPQLLRKPKPLQNLGEAYYCLTPNFTAAMPKLPKLRSKKQQALCAKLANSALSVSVIKEVIGNGHLKLIAKWIDEGWIKPHTPEYVAPVVVDTHHDFLLNDEQQNVVDKVSHKLSHYFPSVLYGVTGSGKTEVYLELIKKTVSLGQQVLVMVPEISLTPQLLKRFKDRLATLNMVILTSSVSERERMIGYQASAEGFSQVIIGTRSAIFTPFANLGLIIVDEEHDGSFKQADGLRYNARDLAVYRAKCANIPIVLGSATPSLETLHHVQTKQYSLFKLTKRAVLGANLPQVKVVDLRYSKSKAGLSDMVVAAIKERLSKQELSLIFINRRGYSPSVACYECGWVSTCKNCSSNMVYHYKQHVLKCHYCGLVNQVPKQCPKCKSKVLHTVGQGTQKVEQELVKLFPEAKVARIDYDTTTIKDSWHEIYQKVNDNQIDILVGTQMLAKGHDFHRLTLAVGMELDNGLYSHDFRATEHLFAQLLQVAGRSGRGDRPGEVLLQTSHPEHKLYKYLIKHDFGGFANHLLKKRSQLSLPPYTYYIIFRASSSDIKRTADYLKHIYATMLVYKTEAVQVYPPVSCVMQRLKGQERGQILLYSNNRKELHHLVAIVTNYATTKKVHHDITWSIDVDPLEL